MYHPETKELRFNENGKFRILMISDFHSQGNFNGVGRCRFRQKLKDGIETLLNETNPDFVMLGGDQCLSAGRSEQIDPEEDKRNTRDTLADVMEGVNRRGIPWAHVYGNHDAEHLLTKEELEPIYESFPLCLSQRGPEDIHGVGNYVLPVYASKGDRIAYNLFALDSNREMTDYIQAFGVKEEDNNIKLPFPFSGGSTNGMPYFDQVMWYYQTSQAMEKQNGQRIPAVLFMHTPCLEFNLIHKNPEETGMIGHKRESLGNSDLNSGLFFACLERGDVKGIFCGHEHLNNYQGKYCGITMAYDSCVGFDMTAHDDLRGGRVIDLDEASGTFETRHITLMSLMGDKAIRDPGNTFYDYEKGLGEMKYFIRQTHL